MRFSLVDADLFKYSIIPGSFQRDHRHRVPVHCISADFAMGGGIAVPMAEKYNLRKALADYEVSSPDCIYVNGVMNLITKDKVWDKPTYDSMKGALEECRRICEDFGIKYLVMPKIGCGIDGLDWAIVKMLVKQIFRNVDIDILVCIPGMSKEKQ